MQSDGADQAPDDPPIVFSHLAYFFVPLPEPLGFVDNSFLRILEHAPMEWWVLDTGVPAMIHTSGSLMFHQVARSSPEGGEIDALFEIARAAIPSTTTRRKPLNQVALKEHRREAPMTVVEMAIGLDLPTDEYVANGDDEDSAAWIALSDAFDKGLQYVRDVQRAYYFVRRQPVRLISRQAMPFAIPFAVRRIYGNDGEPLPFAADLSMYLLHMNVTYRDDDLEDAEWHGLQTALTSHAVSGAFWNYIEFQREALVALERDGRYRSAVLFAGMASEALFDDLLAHMLWEEAIRPEDAAGFFEPRIVGRVKTAYHARLGGIWDIDKPGPIQSWAINVARLRNRVVHAGYEPNLEEARQSVEASQGLESYLCDLVANRAKRYPRTALILPGPPGLKRRGLWSRSLEELQNDRSEVNWTETFGRWRTAMRRAQPDSPLAIIPSATDAPVYFVLRANGRHQWVVHDRRAGLAALVDRDGVSGLRPQQEENLEMLITRISADPLHSDISTYLAGAQASEPPLSAWKPEYRAVPLAGVMVNGDDLDPT